MFTHFFERDYSVTISRLFLFALIAMLPFMGGCGEDDNPIVDDPDHDHDHGDAPIHADVDGFNLEIDGKVVYHQHQGHHEGGLTVPVGEEIEIHVHFLDANEAELHLDEVAPPPGEDDHDHDHDHGGLESFSLGLTGYDASIIQIHLDHDDHDHEGEEHDDDHDDDHDDHDHEGEEHGDALPFGLEGLKAGTTTIKLQLIHGDHPDYTAALLIPVTVQ
ncbi:MAG: hypothetical protein OXI67_19455 [Candidatus Poribacteria bacterium]|nr:hypothetical protein [Candidatus Poribacteria bacterium]